MHLSVSTISTGMATIRIADSLKYGAKLFMFFLAVAVVGGGGMVAGAALAIPELQTYLDSGSLGTTTLAGGAVLAVLGTVIWVSGTFAIAYKLIGDAVADGLRASQATPTASTTGTTDGQPDTEETAEADSSPDEQPADEHPADEQDPGQAVPGAADAPATDGEPAQPPAEQPAQADSPPQEPAGAADQRREPAGPVQEQPQGGASATQEPPAEEPKPEAGRERTAEEIAFGTSGSREQSPPEDQPSQRNAGAEEMDVPDGEPEVDAELEEDVDPDETLADERENVETANSTGADPLADQFDDS